METKIQAVRDVAREFLVRTILARDVRVVRVLPEEDSLGIWRVEAEVLVPNLAVKSLGLPLSNEVLERQHYALHLDADLNITAYDCLETSEP